MAEGAQSIVQDAIHVAIGERGEIEVQIAEMRPLEGRERGVVRPISPTRTKSRVIAEWRHGPR